MLMPDDTPLADAGADCDRGACTSALTVNVIRADNQAFGAGFYDFTLALPDSSSLSIECYLGHVETGMQCQLGNTDVLTALLGQQGDSLHIVLLGAPEWTTVTIKYNDLTIGQRTLIPTYASENGSTNMCPTDCQYAEEAMAVESW